MVAFTILDCKEHHLFLLQKDYNSALEARLGKGEDAQSKQNQTSARGVLHTFSCQGLNSAKIFPHGAFSSTCRCLAAQDLLPDSCNHLVGFHSRS